MIEYLSQNHGMRIIQTKKTVEWLVENTFIKKFDPLNFSGYQRSIDSKHMESIVEYIEKSNNFYLPTSIICSIDEEYSDSKNLFVVDGQHRIEAFKHVNAETYKKIKRCEVSVIVLENPGILLEIETFITINKTSKRVDTSLAYVLKSMLNRNKTSDEINSSFDRRNYISVESAYKLNYSEDYSRWTDRIMFEGSPRKYSYQFLSLNAFVKAIRRFLSVLENKKIMEFKWENNSDIEDNVDNIIKIIESIYDALDYKWNCLCQKNDEEAKIIRGPIGLNSILRYIEMKIGTDIFSYEDIIKNISLWINQINENIVTFDMWLPK